MFLNSLWSVFGFFGFYIIPKWLIKVPGHIPILFGWFRELRKFGQNLDPEPSQLSPKYFNKYKEIMEASLKILFFHISTFWNFEHFSKLDSQNTYFFWYCFGTPPPKKIGIFYHFSFCQNNRSLKIFQNVLWDKSFKHANRYQFVGGGFPKTRSKEIGSGEPKFEKFSKFQKVEIWKNNIC